MGQFLSLRKIREDGNALKDASPEIKNNEKIVMMAVKNKGEALQFASDTLRGNEVVVQAAVKKNCHALEFASAELRGNESIVKAAVQKNGDALQFASDDLKGNKSIVMKAVKQNGEALQFASIDLRRNKEIVNAAVQQNPSAKIYAKMNPVDIILLVAGWVLVLCIAMTWIVPNEGNLACISYGDDDPFIGNLISELKKKGVKIHSPDTALVGVDAKKEFRKKLQGYRNPFTTQESCKILIAIYTPAYFDECLECLEHIYTCPKHVKFIPILQNMDTLPKKKEQWTSPSVINKKGSNGVKYHKMREKVHKKNILELKSHQTQDPYSDEPDKKIVDEIKAHFGLPPIKSDSISEFERQLRKNSEDTEGKTRVLISFATGRREDYDDEGVGPGSKYAADLAMKLHENGVKSHSSLHTLATDNWWTSFEDKLEKECEVLILIMTPAFFKSKPCLKEVYTAAQNQRIEIIRVLYEVQELPKRDEWWPNAATRNERKMKDDIMKRKIFSDQFHNAHKFNLEPPKDLIDDVKKLLE